MKFLKYLVLSSSLITLFSCNNEVELAGPYKNIPVVYGLLDYRLDTNFIRVNKAFLGNGNALVYAQQQDSIYYDTLHVYLLKYPNPSATQHSDSIVLFKTVNAVHKDSGIFAYMDNILYATTKNIDHSATYELNVYMPKWTQNVKAKIKLCGPIVFSNPLNLSTLIRFESTTANTPPFSFRWTNDANTKVFQFAIRFNYYEWPLSNPSNVVVKSAYREFAPFDGSTSLNNGNVVFQVSKDEFYSTLTSNIAPNPNVARRVKDIDLMVTQIAPDLQKYIEINKPTYGLVNKTGSYTNLSGDALGIFSSRTKFESKGYKFDNLTTDSIIGGQHTSNLGFVH